nr:AF211533_1 Avr9/Cf-9 rapidly elicited protein 146 [Ipomoea batatas]
MEPNNLPVIAKRFWNVVRAALFMLRQGISKKKLMLDLNLRNCGGDLPGAAAFADPAEAILKKLNKHLRISASSAHAPPPTEEEIMIAAEEIVLQSAMASPALPGFGRTPSVRQLRVTDSLFLFSDSGSSHVDEAAENFISRFYDDLRRQNAEQ